MTLRHYPSGRGGYGSGRRRHRVAVREALAKPRPWADSGTGYVKTPFDEMLDRLCRMGASIRYVVEDGGGLRFDGVTARDPSERGDRRIIEVRPPE